MANAQQRTITALKIHAFRNKGYLSARQLDTLQLPTTAVILEEVLLSLQSDGVLHLIQTEDGDTIYDLLPLLEKTAEESALDIATRFQLAQIHIARKMWTHAIADLRLTCTHPKFKKESLYLLGQCCEQKGAVEKAREHYERLLAVDYYYLDTLERLSALNHPHQQTTLITPPTTSLTTSQAVLPAGLRERYEVIREVGRGGAGIVYQAIDLKLKRDVALKVLYHQASDAAGSLSQFLQEARVIAHLKHANIIDVYDVDVEARCIAMEFVAGGTLREFLKQHPRLPVESARSIIVQLCRGLQAAHQAGVLHRDIKPANIFLTTRHTVKLGDFGIAHIANAEQDTFMHLSAHIGTLPYMSPEQVRGDPLTPASDIYAVGVVLYELLTGAPPFTQGDIAYHQVYSSPPPPSVVDDLAAIILRCLAKHPDERFSSAQELSRALKCQAQNAKERLDKYRNLLKVALVDKELNESELKVLRLKRQSLQLSEQEARQVERELGLQGPA